MLALGNGGVPSVRHRREDDSVAGADVDESTLGTVPDASLLENQPSSAFAPSAVERFHNVGDPGEPEFLNGWSNALGHATAAFYKDPWGVVHMKGIVVQESSQPSVIFVLPEGYTLTGGWTLPQAVFIGGNGQVFSQAGGVANLNGITFRAAGE